MNAYRFSIEWSRIQPKENQWDEDAIAHYQEIVHILIENYIEPMITLHHFTHPLWFIKKYPWHEARSIEKFMTFTEKILSSIHGVRYWITFNEPYVLILGGYLEGCMPPGVKDGSLALRAMENILICHGQAYDIIHARMHEALVSVAHNMAALGLPGGDGIRWTGSDSQRREMMSEIQQQAHTLRELIEDILELSRYDSKRSMPQKQWFDLVGHCDDLIARLEPSIREKNLALEVSRQLDSAYVRADPQQVMRVLRNLLSNAIKYTSEGGRIGLRLEQGSGEVRLSVSDSGIGIAPEDQ